MHIFFPLFFPTFYSVFIKTCIPCSGSTYNTNCCCRIVVAELPLFSPRLAPLLQFSLSPHHGGLEQWTCHEILQKLSPCSCRGDSVVQTLLWSDLWSVRACDGWAEPEATCCYRRGEPVLLHPGSPLCPSPDSSLHYPLLTSLTLLAPALALVWL